MQFEIDSGAACNIISESVAENLGTKIYPTSTKVTAYDGGAVQLRGETFCPIQIGDEVRSHKFIIACGNKVN